MRTSFLVSGVLAACLTVSTAAPVDCARSFELLSPDLTLGDIASGQGSGNSIGNDSGNGASVGSGNEAGTVDGSGNGNQAGTANGNTGASDSGNGSAVGANGNSADGAEAGTVADSGNGSANGNTAENSGDPGAFNDNTAAGIINKLIPKPKTSAKTSAKPWIATTKSWAVEVPWKTTSKPAHPTTKAWKRDD